MHTTNRDVIEWVDWAFDGALHGSEPPSRPRSMTATGAHSSGSAGDENSDSAEDLIEIVWGTNSQREAIPIVLDEVPDVSNRHKEADDVAAPKGRAKPSTSRLNHPFPVSALWSTITSRSSSDRFRRPPSTRRSTGLPIARASDPKPPAKSAGDALPRITASDEDDDTTIERTFLDEMPAGLAEEPDGSMSLPPIPGLSDDLSEEGAELLSLEGEPTQAEAIEELPPPVTARPWRGGIGGDDDRDELDLDRSDAKRKPTVLERPKPARRAITVPATLQASVPPVRRKDGPSLRQATLATVPPPPPPPKRNKTTSSAPTTTMAAQENGEPSVQPGVPNALMADAETARAKRGARAQSRGRPVPTGQCDVQATERATRRP